jgi:short-subunit dehydrogenase
VNIIILGCGNIGYEVVLELNNENYDIWVVDIILPEYLKPILETNERIHFIKADATNYDQLMVLLNFPIDVMLCTVGTISKATSIDDWEQFKKDFNINFFGNLVPIKVALNKNILRNGARIIVISSTSGHFAPESLIAYAPSKWALENFCGSLRGEMTKLNITVDVVSPFNLKNLHSTVFNTDKGIDPKKVVKKILKLIKHPKNCNHYVPYRYRGYHLLERIFPSIIDSYLGLGISMLRRHKLHDLQIKSALITGASSGLGRELAITYSKLDSLYLIARSEESLRQLKQEIHDLRPQCQVQISPVDITSEEQVRSYVNNIPQVDLVINNAGIHAHAKISDTPIEIYQKNLATNFFGPVFLISELERQEKSPVKIINILSTTAIAGLKYLSSYSASKAALWCYTRSLRRVLGKSCQVVEVLPMNFQSNLIIKKGVWIQSDTKSNDKHIGTTMRLLMARERLLSSREVAQKVIRAEESGSEYLMIPGKARLYLLLEALAPSVFKSIFK